MNRVINERGWAIGYTLHPSTGLFGDLQPYSPVGKPSGRAIEKATHVVYTGAGVTGISFVRQLGKRYIALTRCAYSPGYTCAMEFHDASPAKSLGSRSVSGHSFSTSYELDPGMVAESQKKGKPAEKKGSKNSKKKAEKRKKPNRDPEQRDAPNPGTCVHKMPIPAGAAALDVYLPSDRGWFDVDYMYVLFSSASEPMQDVVLAQGHFEEDSIHRLTIPALQETAIGFEENEVYVIYKLQYVYTPRCIVPIGDCPKAAKSEKKSGGTKRPKRKLLATDGTPFGGEAWEVEPDDEHVTYQLSEMKYAEWEDTLAWQMSDTSGVARRLDSDEGVDPDMCITGSNVVYEAEKTLFEKTKYFTVGPLPMSLSVEVFVTLETVLEVQLCVTDKTVSASLYPIISLIAVVEGAAELAVVRGGMGVEATIIRVMPIPTGTMGILPSGALRFCLDLDLKIESEIRLYVFVEYFVCVEFKEKCVDVGFTEVCVPIPYPVWCPRTEEDIWTHYLPVLEEHLFTICSTPTDSTPPETSGARVNAAQIDETTIQVDWTGFYDGESRIESYEVCIGSGSPGNDDVTPCTIFDGSRQRGTVQVSIDEDEEDKTYYAFVRATNGEELSSTASTKFYIDKSAPEVVNGRALRFRDKRYMSDEDAFSPLMGTRAVDVEFQVEENHPFIKITSIAWAVGTEEYGSDVMPFADIGQGDAIDKANSRRTASTGTLHVSAADLEMEHRGIYYVTVSTMNSLGISNLFTIPVQLVVDTTPPYTTRFDDISIHNGASLYMQITDSILPLSHPQPVAIANTFLATPSWANGFRDDETAVIGRYRWTIIDDLTAQEMFSWRSLEDATTEEYQIQPSQRLKHAETYRIAVESQNDAGVWGLNVSYPFIVDLTRPDITQVLDLKPDAPPIGTEDALRVLSGQFRRPLESDYFYHLALSEATRGATVLLGTMDRLARDTSYVQEMPESWRFSYVAWDDESGLYPLGFVSVVSLGVGPLLVNYPFSTRRRDITIPMSLAENEMEPFRVYRAMVTIGNAAGLVARGFSDGLMVDPTPPVVVGYRVMDGHHPILDASFTYNATALKVIWRWAFDDLESRIDHFELS
ncbi:unnamed protein product, partial [Symbiodinium sp. KB8]